MIEIPIYAFSPYALSEKVLSYQSTLKEKIEIIHVKQDTSHNEQFIFYSCHPFQIWEYNHIVGFIVIRIKGSDVFFELYLQAHGIYKKSKYLWRSKKKWFLENQRVNGYHFRLNEDDNNENIRSKIHLYLEGMINELVPKKYFVDLESFNYVDKMLDYTKLLLNRD